jgi:HD superfamily phosphohydrolase
MPSIIDPIYGHVAISTLEQLIINTPEMARLRRIQQLGLADLAFPGALNIAWGLCSWRIRWLGRLD